MPQQQPQANPQVQPSTPPPDAPAPEKTPQQIAQEMLAAKMQGIQLDPATLQVLMALMMPVVGEMGRAIATELRKPSPEEEKKLLAEQERIRNQRIAAAKAGELEASIIKSQQSSCPHIKPNGQHTFRGQVHSNGWALIRCIRCQLPFTVRPLPEHVQNGLNLDMIPGLTAEHLRAWQAQSDKIDRQLAKNEEAMRKMSAGFNKMAPNAVTL